jgi:ABC-type transport system involved in multi-copper enzyme maturation permease subunit
MLARLCVVMFNTYREAVRARILLGLFGLALATAAYTLVVGEYAHKDAERIISNVGSFSISIYSVIVAIVLGATSLYREIELKTVFPILARPIRRSEYLLGKFFGTVATLGVFIVANVGVLLLCLHFMSSGHSLVPLAVFVASALPFIALAVRAPSTRTWLPIVWAATVFVCGFVLAADAPGDRRVLLASSLLSLFEVSILTALATLFSSFSTPFMTAVFTVGVFLVGRSADTLARLPARVFGQGIHDLGSALAKVFPNLMVYVPPRPLLLGESIAVSLGQYLAVAGLQALGWSVGLLLCATLLFARKDFV